MSIGLYQDIFEYAFNSLRKRKLRSWLTVLGIIIGITAIITLIALGWGADSEIRKQLSFFGSDVINVGPKTSLSGMSWTESLTEEDVKAIKKLGNIKYISPIIYDSLPVRYGDEEVSLMVSGSKPELADIYKFEVGEGRLPGNSERGVAVVGYSLAHNLFEKNITVNKRVYIDNRSFLVAGIFKKSGSGLMSFMDSVIYISYEDARTILPSYQGNNRIAEIHLEVYDEKQVPAMKTSIESELRRLHKEKVGEETFEVITADFLMEQVGAIFALLTLFLGGIGAISLVVGSVGIANTMFMSVLERTHEIGILKAIGAEDSTIMKMFLVESALIGLLGGALGIILSLLFSFIINTGYNFFGMSGQISIITPLLVIFALGFSVLVGVIAGYLPARRAAKLNAVEALRYE